MALSATVLTSGWSTANNTGPTPYVTASVTPAADAVLVLVVAYTGTGAQPDPTITGLGLTWEEFTSSEAARTVAIWRAKGTGTAGTISIAPPSAWPYTSCYWTLIQFTGADLNQAIGQTAVQNGSGTAASVSLADPPASGAATIAGFLQSVDTTTTPRTGWTEASDQPGTAPISTLEVQYKIPGEQTASADFAATGNWRAVLVSVKEAVVSGGSGSASGSTAYEGVALGPISQPTYVSKTSANQESSTSLTIPAPAGVTSGMRQFVVLGFNSGDEPTNNTPTGWTQILAYDNPHAAGGAGENERVEVWTSTTDTGAVTFTKGGSVIRWYGLRTAYAGVDSIAGITSQPQTGNNTRSNTHTIPSQTTTVAKSMVLAFLTSETNIGETWTSPGGWSERHNANVGSVGLDPLHISLVDRVEATPTTVSGHSFTSAANEWSTTGSLRLLPVPAGVNDGTASGTFTFTGAATGARTPKGSATGTFAYVGTVTGKRTPKGTASGTFTFAGTVSGEAPPNGGTASGTFTFTGAATGEAPATFGAPTGLTATPISDDQIDLSWNSVPGATGYDVERDGVIIATDVATASYSDTGLTANTEYDYRVRAVG